MARPQSLTKRAREGMFRRVADLHRRGKTHEQIAEEIGISRDGVRYWIKKLRASAAHAISDKAGQMLDQVERLGYVYGESIEAWNASKGATVRTTQEQAQGDDVVVSKDGKARGGKRSRVQRVEETTPGDPAYLAQARGALADVRQLLGINAPSATMVGVGGLEGSAPIKHEHSQIDRAEYSAGIVAAAIEAGIIGTGPARLVEGTSAPERMDSDTATEAGAIPEPPAS